MTRLERQVVYVPDKDVIEARSKGMTNLSAFVREKLIEYNTGALSAKSEAPASAPIGGQNEI
jgi:hypothetical protein